MRATSCTLRGGEACDCLASGATWATGRAIGSQARHAMSLSDRLVTRNFRGDSLCEHTALGAFSGNGNYLGDRIISASANDFGRFVRIS